MEENKRHMYSKSKEHYSDAWGKHSRLNATKICEEKKCIGIEKTKSSAKMLKKKKDARGIHNIQQAERY